MMNYIWGSFLIISIICGFITGKSQEISNAVLTGASDAITLIISISGMMALWTGLMKIAEESGLTSKIAKLFSPLIKLLFPDLPSNSTATRAICMNITANLLGLGNAATPLGINAMREMQKLNPDKSCATNSMVMFVVINTASLQLLPTLLCTIRQKHGSQNPLDILPCLWIASALALTCGVFIAKFLGKVTRKKHG